MELNDPRQQQQHHFTSYFSSTPTTTNTPSPPNGLLPPHHPTDSTTPTGSHLLYPHSMGPSTTATVTGGGAPVEATSAKRKRGRPRKYGTPELALAAKKTATSASVAASRERKEQHQAGSSSTTSSFSGSSSKKSQKQTPFSLFRQLQNKEMPDHRVILNKFRIQDKLFTVKATEIMRTNTFLNRSTRSKTWNHVSGRKKEGKLVLKVEKRRWSEETDLEIFLAR